MAGFGHVLCCNGLIIVFSGGSSKGSTVVTFRFTKVFFSSVWSILISFSIGNVLFCMPSQSWINQRPAPTNDCCCLSRLMQIRICGCHYHKLLSRSQISIAVLLPMLYSVPLAGQDQFSAQGFGAQMYVSLSSFLHIFCVSFFNEFKLEQQSFLRTDRGKLRTAMLRSRAILAHIRILKGLHIVKRSIVYML